MRHLLQRLATAVLPPRELPAGRELRGAGRYGITPSTHNYTSCAYSYYYRAWVKRCRDCGRVIAC